MTHILITNDDGIHAPGLAHLWQAVADMADTTIVAPSGEKSGSGLSITWVKPLHLHQVPWQRGVAAWSLNGTPADCIKMGLKIVLGGKKPDLIVSGANKGSNSGRTVLYSGTVGGIIEGALKGIPGIAFSFCDHIVPPLEITGPIIQSIVRHTLEHALPPGTFFNVTFPLNTKEGTRGIRFAKQGLGYWTEAPEQRIHPDGLPYYWLGGKWSAFPEDPESDVALLEQGYVTCVPIHVSHLTDMAALQKHARLWEGVSSLS
ncbi:MAG: 5-nucleotidase surE [Chlamydiota bacterium]|jgi:5'-nucleotidase